MRAVVLLCLLEAAFAQPWYQWEDPVNPEKDSATDTACVSNRMSCGCCLMQGWMKRMEGIFNREYEGIKEELTNAKTALDSISGDRSVFSVTLDNVGALSCNGPFSHDSIIVYTHAFINLENHYDVQSGVFTAPHSGVYSLSVTIYAKSAPGQTLAACARLRVNGHVLSELHDNGGQDVEDSATVVVAATLESGDQVSVMLPSGCVVCDDDNHFNTFTGFLLYAH